MSSSPCPSPPGNTAAAPRYQVFIAEPEVESASVTTSVPSTGGYETLEPATSPRTAWGATSPASAASSTGVGYDTIVPMASSTGSQLATSGAAGGRSFDPSAATSSGALEGTVPLAAGQDRFALVEGLKRALARAEDDYAPPDPNVDVQGATVAVQPANVKKNREPKVRGSNDHTTTAQHPAAHLLLSFFSRFFSPLFSLLRLLFLFVACCSSVSVLSLFVLFLA